MPHVPKRRNPPTSRRVPLVLVTQPGLALDRDLSFKSLWGHQSTVGRARAIVVCGGTIMRKTNQTKVETKKLQVSVETIRQLDDKALLAVVGGGTRKAGGETGSCAC